MGNDTTSVFNNFIGSVLLFAIIKVSTGIPMEEARLIHNLLEGYDTDARPVKNISQTLPVGILFGYNQLQDLDEPTQVLHLLVFMRLEWNDEFLRWNASDYGGSSVLHLKPTRIWTPDLELFNNMEQDNGYLSNDKYRITVNSDGNVSWFITQILRAPCPIDISRFPYDVQECKIRLGLWTYDASKLELQLREPDGISLVTHVDNAQWKLASIRSERLWENYPCCAEPFTDIVYTMKFERKPLYYIMTIIFPSELLFLLACISFLFPACSGERVTLVVSVLLGLVVFMLIVNERTPVTSDGVPMITIYFNSIGTSIVLALIATAFILRLKHVSSGKPVPRYLARIRDCIAIAVYMKKVPPKNRTQLNVEEILLRESSTQLNELVPRHAAMQKSFTEQKILFELQKLSKHLKDENIASEMIEDWHYTMKVFDKLFFIIFFIIFCALTGYVFSFSYKSSQGPAHGTQ